MHYAPENSPVFHFTTRSSHLFQHLASRPLQKKKKNMNIFNPFDPYSFDSTFQPPHDFCYRQTFRGRPFPSYNPIPPLPWSPSNSWERPPWRRYQRESLPDYPSHDEYGFRRSHSDGIRETCARRYTPYHDTDVHWVPRMPRYRNRSHRQRPIRFPWSYYAPRSAGERGPAQRPAESGSGSREKEKEKEEEEAYEVEEPDTDGVSRGGSNAHDKKPEKSRDSRPYPLRPRVRCIVSAEVIPQSATSPTRPVFEPSPGHPRSSTPDHHHSSSQAPEYRHSSHSSPLSLQSPSLSSSSSSSSFPVSEAVNTPFLHASGAFQIDKAQRALKHRRKALREAKKESDKEGRRIEQQKRQLREMEVELREAEQSWRENTQRLEDQGRGLKEEENSLDDWRLTMLLDVDEPSDHRCSGEDGEGDVDELEEEEEEEERRWMVSEAIAERRRRMRMEWRYGDGDAEAERFWKGRVWDEDEDED